MLYYIVFISRLLESDIHKQQQMFSQFVDNNIKLNITGMLVCYTNEIIQIIEGEEDDVKNLYAKVVKDKRHTQTQILKSGNLTHRLFPNTPMRYELFPQQLDTSNLSDIFNTMSELKKISILFDSFIKNLTK